MIPILRLRSLHFIGFIFLSLCIFNNSFSEINVTPYISIRSQSRDKTRQVVGLANLTHVYDMESWYGTISGVLEYTQTFHPHKIAHCLFGDDIQCDNILIQGSEVADRNPLAWFADYFYLPTDFNGAISFSPKIQNILFDLDLYFGLDEWLCGLYFRIYGPITHTRWDLNFCEQKQTGTTGYPIGYSATTEVPVSALLTSFSQYAKGEIPNIDNGITYQRLKFARIDNCSRSKTGFADLRFELGWDFLQSECYHLGVNIQGAAPTGNKVCAKYVFEPIIGNGHHWELGGGATGHYIFWMNQEEDIHAGIYFDANITHLFNANQQRTFDLCNNPNSRYMLAARMGAPIVNNLTGSTGSFPDDPTPASTAPTKQFKNEFAPVANLTTLDVKVSVGLQADIVAWFNFTACNFSWDIGYNFWGRSCERINCPDTCFNQCNSSSGADNINTLCSASQDNQWVLKGDARVFGFATDTAGGLTAGDPVALSASEIRATIHNGTNATATSSILNADPKLTNAGVDNAQFAYAGTTDQRLVYAPAVANVSANHIQTSINSIFINCNDINFQRTRGLSNKIFTHISYTWDRDCWLPYVGVGGFAEFGITNSSCASSCSDECRRCIDCAISQWGVWIKGGVAFN